MKSLYLPHLIEVSLVSCHNASVMISLRSNEICSSKGAYLHTKAVFRQFYPLTHECRAWMCSDQLCFLSAGAVYTTAEQKQVPLSLLGAMNTNDKHFSIPHRKPQTFPFKQHCQMPELARCHFLCQCARLVYEDAAVIQDVVSRR